MGRYFYGEFRSFFPQPFYRAEVVRRLIFLNVGVFFLQLVSGLSFTLLFGLTPHRFFAEGMLWQVVTYMFLHGGFFHLFFNMFILWMFGNDLEGLWGSKRFLTYYLITGVGAGLTALLFYWDSPVPIIGASGAIFGLLLAYALEFPRREVLVFFLFPMQARHFVILIGFLELLNILSHSQAGVANFSHLGGMLFGFLFFKYEKTVAAWLAERKTAQKQTLLTEQEKKTLDRKWTSQEIDEILDKIRQEGMGSITQAEWNILRRAKDS